MVDNGFIRVVGFTGKSCYQRRVFEFTRPSIDAYKEAA
jgi:hypothetical protein